MALDQFKTQVLLLHSEQSALDKFSSGFSDRYTVHCATSGTEALNFLGDTPIHVIVSAQELPGMSGAEALREAKKRSPETIGILLASQGDTSIEAVVGDEEVFEVVRGNVQPDGLIKLIENATQRMRLMALAESANDTAALPDETIAEHIVMETSENGSTIISDGTGRLPALDPKKVSAAAAVGSRGVDVLVLTQDEEFLSTVRDSARGLHNVHTANTLAQADDTTGNHNVGVAVVDAAMVGSNVEKLTLHLRKTTPRLVSIVAGRRDDGEMLMDLINRGKVYRFLLKPVSPGRARLAIEASIKHHLEAPDSAFKLAGSTVATALAPKPAAKPAPKKAPKPQPVAAPKPAKAEVKPKATPKPKPKPKPKAKPKAKKKAAPAATPRKIEPTISNPSGNVSPIDSRLDDAFGDDDTSFTQTMTGIVASVGKSITDIKDSIADRKAEKSEAPLIDVAPVMKPDPEPAPAPEPAVADDSGGSPFTNPKILGMAAVAIAVVIAGVFWALSGSDEVEPPAQAAIVETPTDGAESISESALPGEPVADISEILEEARLARDAGQVFNPPGGNAIELYLSASAADPANSEVAAELDAVIEQALALAETAVLESRTNDASAALQRVALADPDNPRLPFLTAQVEQMQLRNYVDDARAAVRDTRFEDAASLITAARSLDVPDTSAIDSVEDELNAARSARQADEVIALASARLEEGRLIEPANDNARYYYELALSNDPNNTAARQGLVVVASKLVLSARAQIDGGEFSAAESLLADAEQLDPTSAEVAASITALAAARDRVARDLARAEEERRAAAERARLEQERADAEARAEAERQAQARRDAEAAAAQPEPEPEPSTIPVAAAIAGGAAAVGGSGSADPEASAQEPATASQEPARQEAGPVAQQPEPEPESGSAEPRPVSISQLKRTRYVAPKYPRSAQRRDLSGHVDVVFTVNSSGGVEDIVVRDSEPGDVFVNSAINAVEKWEFEPVIENGGPVPRRVGVRLMFAIE